MIINQYNQIMVDEEACVTILMVVMVAKICDHQ